MGSSQHTRRIGLVALALLAIVFRGNQFLDQVLVDDEWHALHQVMNGDLRSIVTSFGLADYSIPLTLYYKALAHTIGLSELGMRAPMFIASIAMVVIFSGWVWARAGSRVAIAFGVLMIASPLLFYYSRIARPYGLSLLLAPIALWWFHRWWSGGSPRFAMGYVTLSVLLTWLHLLNAPFVFAPMLWATWQLWRTRNGASQHTQSLRSWARLALAIGLALIVFVGPPFLMNPTALSEKAGSDLPTVETWLGAAHQWAGTASRFLLVLIFALAVIGARRAWRLSEAFAATVILGLLCSVAAVFVMQPAWVFHPLTMARYLVLVVPVLLLCAACGIDALVARESARTLRIGLHAFVVTALAWGTVATSPLASMHVTPTQYSTHSYFHFDVRIEKNPTRPYVESFPQSPALDALAASVVRTKTIAYFPWSLFSYDNDHPVLQARLGQRLIPASAEGLCTSWWPGHPRRYENAQSLVALKNFVILSDAVDVRAKAVDFVVMRKSFSFNANFECRYVEFSEQSPCFEALRARYGAPVIEDDVRVVFRVVETK